MAFIFSKEQLASPVAVEPVALIDRKIKPRPIAKESELCDIFMRDFSKVDGWTCYPEAAGFDVLVVHRDGRQIGVEAKLSLNAKVADQILPKCGDDYYGSPGPDHRLVIVSRITDASAGIAKMLHRLGVTVMNPHLRWMRQGYEFYFDLEGDLFAGDKGTTYWGKQCLFDWSPAERCYVPAMVTSLPAGVPSPIRLTPWKEAAVKLVALMRSQGFITVKQIAAHGMGSTRWTQHTDKPAWLAKGNARGQWIETEHMPAFDKQHPALYAMAVEALAARSPETFDLTQ